MRFIPQALFLGLLLAGSALVCALCWVVRESGYISDWPLGLLASQVISSVLGLSVLGFVAFPIGCYLLIFPSRRQTGLKIVTVCAGTAVGAFSAQGYAEEIRRKGLERATIRARPLIRAIRQYESAYSRPPNSFTNLMIDLRYEIPKTGMHAYPNYHYVCFVTNEPAFGNNRWYLSVKCSRGVGHSDVLIYFPNGQYQDRDWYRYYKTPERILDWAYVHE